MSDAVEAVVYSRLSTTSAINTALGGEGRIFEEFRDNVSPSIAYELSLDAVEETYGDTGPVHFTLSVLVVADAPDAAKTIADAVVTALDREEWSGSGFRVVGCFFRDREKGSLAVAGKNKRLSTVTLAFDFSVDGPTAAS